jgi:hypothetical protein
MHKIKYRAHYILLKHYKVWFNGVLLTDIEELEDWKFNFIIWVIRPFIYINLMTSFRII